MIGAVEALSTGAGAVHSRRGDRLRPGTGVTHPARMVGRLVRATAVAAVLLALPTTASAPGGGPPPGPPVAQAGLAQAGLAGLGSAEPGPAQAGLVEPGPAEPGYRWPLAGEPGVTRWFEPPVRRWLPGHRGVDLAGEPEAVVRAAGSGTVFFAGPVAGRGVVSVAHPGGLRTTYEPVTATVTAGEPVSAGDPIGVLAPGHPGCPIAACLHWGLRRGDVYLDPLSLLGLGRVRLLPHP